MNEVRLGKRRLRDSPLVKMIVIGMLIAALLIPLAMVGSLVAERRARRDEAVHEVAATWGGEQTLFGPLLTVPYLEQGTDAQGRPTTYRTLARFLPETLDVQGRMIPHVKRRGIFQVVLYEADLHLAGTFAHPSFADWPIAPGDVFWDEAYLSFGVPDLRGLRQDVRLRFAGRDLPLEPGGGEADLWESGLRAGLGSLGPGLKPGMGKTAAGATYPFSLDLDVGGSERLTFLPAGRITTAALASSWPHPSFTGAYLPAVDAVGPRGFTARWSVSRFGRSFPARWRSADREAAPSGRALVQSAFGVELREAVDAYQKTERARKYGVLFLLLTFVTFFLYEVFNPIALHPLQYLLVGAALCLFYLLLLSLSEHLPFAAAYGIAAVATVGLIAGYSLAALRGRLRALLMGGILGVLYGYLYVLLQAEDYALLLGSVGLFVILAAIMYVTRRIDWYAAREETPVRE